MAAVVLMGSWPADCELGALPEPGLHAQDKLHGRPGEQAALAATTWKETLCGVILHGTITFSRICPFITLLDMLLCSCSWVYLCWVHKQTLCQPRMIWRTCQACERLHLLRHSSAC